ncbi:MAG: hypothetical protein CMC15_17030 [Flavobacteriaceae bacterium]|nr:hypothetical protein [Flavobacteriaceae bacterium]
MTTKDTGLFRVGTPEKARKILLKLVKDGKITIEDLDKESPGAAYVREIAEKYYPEIKLKPHRNLLSDIKPTESVEIINKRDLDPGSVSDASRTTSQILGQEEEPIYSTVGVSDSVGGIDEPLPF